MSSRMLLRVPLTSLARYSRPVFTSCKAPHACRRRWAINRINKVERRSRSSSGSGSVTGVFDRQELSEPEGFDAATAKALAAAAEIVNQLCSTENPTSVCVIDLFDELSDVLCKVADLAECIRLVHPDPEVVERAQGACLAIGSYVEQLNTNTELHRALKHAMDSEEFSKLDQVTRRTAESFMHDFQISGIHLDDASREKVVKLNDQILELSHQFMHNASQPVLLEKDTCPSFLVQNFPSDSQYVVVDHVASLSPNPQLRAASYLIYHSPSSTQQQQVLEVLLSLRDQLAKLVGYPTYAHRVLESAMAETPETVYKFLELLNERILPLAREDVQKMSTVISEVKGSESALHSWDSNYAISLAQRQFSTEIQDAQNWFTVDECLNGLAFLFVSLFDVRMKSVPTRDGEIWDPHVKKFAFVDEGGDLLGYVYCDLYARPGKMATNCHFTIQGGRELVDGSYQLPIITLCCGSPQPQANKPALLSYHSLENLFHEMGHALHSMLGRSKYQNVTGTRCSTDFAEVPSILMEYFLRDHRVLSTLAKHHKTREALSVAAVNSLRISQNIFPAFEAQTQILFAVMDQKFHGYHPLGKSVVELHDHLCREFSPLAHVPNTAPFLRFSHLYGYAGKYYSYLWARAVACLIWKSCFKADPFSRVTGERYRRMLMFGGGLHPKQLMGEMLGFDPTIHDLVDALHQDVLDQRKELDTHTPNALMGSCPH